MKPGSIVYWPVPEIPPEQRQVYYTPLPPMPPEHELGVIYLSSDPERYLDDWAYRRAKLRAAKARCGV